MNLEDHRARVKDCGDILMGQTFANLEFCSQDCDAPRLTYAPDKSNAANWHWQRLQMSAEVVRQSARRQVLSHLSRGLKIQVGMDMFAKTSVHHGEQLATHLRGRMKRNSQQALLRSDYSLQSQPAVEMFDRSVAPWLVFGNISQIDAHQQSQSDKTTQRAGVRGQAKDIAVVDLQNIGKTQPLPSAHYKCQDRFQPWFRLKFDKNGPVEDVPIDQEKPLPPRAFQVTRADQVHLVSLIAVRDMQGGIGARAGAGLRSKCGRRSAARLQDSHDRTQRRQGLVPQTSQLVTDRRRTRQTISFARTATPGQSIANVEDRLENLVRPSSWVGFWRMRTIAQPARTLQQITPPPLFVKPFATSLQMLTDPTHRPACLLQPDCFLPQNQFAGHRSTSRKLETFFRRILSTMSWRLSLPSVSNHLALTCQHSRGASHLVPTLLP